MIFLALTDFVDGKYNLPAASSGIAATNSEVQSYIDSYEKTYIYRLLGVELGNLIIAYKQAGGTGNTDYDKIIGAFSENTALFCGQINQSLGIKEYLQACIYYEYKKDSAYTESLAGTIKADAEVSEGVNASTIMRKAERVFNAILPTIEAIQAMCESNSVAYAGYAGQRIAVKGHQFFI